LENYEQQKKSKGANLAAIIASIRVENDFDILKPVESPMDLQSQESPSE
jgi:hypothetical protein